VVQYAVCMRRTTSCCPTTLDGRCAPRRAAAHPIPDVAREAIEPSSRLRPNGHHLLPIGEGPRSVRARRDTWASDPQARPAADAIVDRARSTQRRNARPQPPRSIELLTSRQGPRHPGPRRHESPIYSATASGPMPSAFRAVSRGELSSSRSSTPIGGASRATEHTRIYRSASSPLRRRARRNDRSTHRVRDHRHFRGQARHVAAFVLVP